MKRPIPLEALGFHNAIIALLLLRDAIIGRAAHRAYIGNDTFGTPKVAKLCIWPGTSIIYSTVIWVSLEFKIKITHSASI
jgi:hypothetical protein